MGQTFRQKTETIHIEITFGKGAERSSVQKIGRRPSGTDSAYENEEEVSIKQSH